MLENFVWQNIPGCSSSKIFPLERKPDVACCNTYLIQSDFMFLLIDPGTDIDLIQRLVSIIDQETSLDPVPVLIVLTHCHYDHFKTTQDLMQRLGTRAVLCVQEQGAKALREGDARVTLSDLYYWQCPQHSVDLELLTEADRSNDGIRDVSLDRLTIKLHNQSLMFSEDKTLSAQSFHIGSQDSVTLYYTPGHNPDSICLQIGNLLFIGDLLFAGNPGVVGIVGWNQKDLIHSLEAIHRVVEQSSIELCLSGHGRPLIGEKVLSILDRCIPNAQKLENIVELDFDRAKSLGVYSKNLLLEIAELFSIISGKLLSLSYHLESLSEEEAARDILEKLDIDAIDHILSEFNQYTNTYVPGSRIEMDIPLRAIQVLAKIQSCFDDQRLQEVINASLLRRGKWLIFDFLQIMQGFREEILGKAENINLLLTEYLTELHKPVATVQDFYESASDESTFTQELIRRIALRNIFEPIDISFIATIGLSDVYLEKERFCDMLTSVLETLVAVGAKKLTVRSMQGVEKIRIEIEALPSIDYFRYVEKKVPFVHRVIQMFGGEMRYETDPNGGRLIVELLPASEVFVVQ